MYGMNDLGVNGYGAAAVASPRLIVPNGPWIPNPSIEELFDGMDKKVKEFLGKQIIKPFKQRVEDIYNLMSGSLGNFSSIALQDSMWGKTAFTAATTIYFGLWSSAVDDTATGATTGESAYTSYARLGLTNNTTIFAAGSGTTTYTKTFPSDATKSFVTSTGTGTNNTITYLLILNGNAGSSADKNYAWCSVTSTTINNGDTPQLAQNAITVVQD